MSLTLLLFSLLKNISLPLLSVSRSCLSVYFRVPLRLCIPPLYTSRSLASAVSSSLFLLENTVCAFFHLPICHRFTYSLSSLLTQFPPLVCALCLSSWMPCIDVYLPTPSLEMSLSPTPPPSKHKPPSLVVSLTLPSCCLAYLYFW